MSAMSPSIRVSPRRHTAPSLLACAFLLLLFPTGVVTSFAHDDFISSTTTSTNTFILPSTTKGFQPSSHARGGAAQIAITWPPNGSTLPTTFTIRCDVVVDDHHVFIQANRHSRVCAGILDGGGGHGTTLSCDDIFTAALTVHDVPTGLQNLVVWLTAAPSSPSQASSTSMLAWSSSPITVVVSEHGPYALGTPLPGMELFTTTTTTSSSGGGGLAPPSEGPDLLDWADAHQHHQPSSSPSSRCSTSSSSSPSPPFLVIIIKSSARAFAARQAIRETWMQDLLLTRSRRRTSDADGGHHEDDRNHEEEVLACFVIGEVSDPQVSQALAVEQAHYQDLLLGQQVPARDSYYGLVDKTALAMRWATTTTEEEAGGGGGERKGSLLLLPGYVMMLDDDVYVRVGEVVRALRDTAPRQRFYAGQVWCAQYGGRPLRPQRDPRHRNYLSLEEYPLEELPPFAIGPHFLLSGDLARYIGDNAGMLRGVGTLEDVSVALWMLALQVHPQHVPWFSNARNFDCTAAGGGVDGGSSLVSLADLTPHGIRQAHHSLHQPHSSSTGGVQQASMCHGFDRLTWVKLPRDLSGMGPHDPNPTTTASPASRQPRGQKDKGGGGKAAAAAGDDHRDGGGGGGGGGWRPVILSPKLGGVYAGKGDLRIQVALVTGSAPTAPTSTSGAPAQVLDPQGEEVCLSIDRSSTAREEDAHHGAGSDDGVSWCTRLALNSTTGEWDVGGLAGGTHTLQVTLPRLLHHPPPHQHSSDVVVVFDTIEPSPLGPAPHQHDDNASSSSPTSSCTTTAPPASCQAGGSASSSSTPLRLSILTPNLDANSQTLIFLTLLLALPRHRYTPTIITASLPTTTGTVTRALVSAGIPIIHFPASSPSCPSPSTIPSTCQPPSLPPLLTHLHHHTDLVISANTMGHPSSSLLLRLAHLSPGRGPLSIMDLPNLHPPINTTLLPPPDALVAPSTFVATHPSITAFTRHYASHLNKTITTTVVHPAALTSPPRPRSPSDIAIVEKPAAFVVGYVGRLGADRSPGLFIHAARKVLRILRSSPPPTREEDIAFVMVGDGPLRQPLEQMLLLMKEGGSDAGGVVVDVRMVGSVGREEVQAWYGAMDVLVNTKQAETFGIANAEAAAAGLPVIALDRGANRESLGWAGDAVTLIPCLDDEEDELLPRRIAEEIVRHLRCHHHDDDDDGNNDHLSSRRRGGNGPDKCPPRRRAGVASPKPPPSLGKEAFVRGWRGVMDTLVSRSLEEEEKGAAQASPTPPPPPPLIEPGAFPAVGRLTVAFSPGARYLLPLLHHLMPRAFPTTQVRIAPITITTTTSPPPPLLATSDDNTAVVVTPDGHILKGAKGEGDDVGVRVVVVSVLEGGERDGWGPKAQAAMQFYRQTFSDAVLILWSGEAWDLEHDLARHQQLGTAPHIVVQAHHHHHQHDDDDVPAAGEIPRIYVPVLSTAVAELSRYGLPQLPALLDQPSSPPKSTQGDGGDGGHRHEQQRGREGVAYLYSRCDRDEREALVDLLLSRHHQVPVMAMGACQGRGRPPLHDRVSGRISATWHDEAVDRYRQANPKFVVAFENTVKRGYVTEKLLLAMLSGAVPVYYGDHHEATRYFHPGTFLHCNTNHGDGDDVASRCADLIASVYHNETLYCSLLHHRPRVSNWTALWDLLSWGHPSTLFHSHRLITTFTTHITQALIDHPSATASLP